MDLTLWKEKGSFFGYKSHQIFTIDEGEGEVLLLIHGFPTASWDWWKVWDVLCRDNRLIALDMIGYGFSDKPKRYSYSIFDQADIVESLLSAKGIDKVHIICHDYGDTVTQELIARHNEREAVRNQGLIILSVCMLNGGLFPEVHRPLFIQKILMGPFGYWVSKLFTKAKLARNLKNTSGSATEPSEEELDSFWELMVHNGGKEVFHLLIRYIKERAENRERWVGALMHTSLPLRFINGNVDPISGKHMADRYREIIPSPDVVDLEEIGHYPSFEAPAVVLRYYQEFRSKITKGSS